MTIESEFTGLSAVPDIEADSVASKAEKATYGSFFLGQNLVFFLVSNFMMLYLTDSVGLSAAVVGTILGITKLWDGINDPLVGIIIDRSKLKKGKFMPWINAAMVLLPAVTVLFFLNPEAAPAVNVAYAFLIYLVWDIIYTFADAPVYALSTVMTNNLNERVSLLSLSRFTGMIGIVIVAVAAMPLITALGWVGTGILISAAAFLTMLPLRFTAKERYPHKREDQISLKQIGQFVFTNKYLLIFYGAFILSAMVNTSQAAMNYFAIYVMGNPNYVSLLNLTLMAPMMIIPLVLPALIRRFGKKPILVWSLVFSIIIGIAFYFVGYSNVTLVIIFSLLRGIGMAPMIMISMFTSDLIEYGHWKTGQRAEAVAFSVQTFATKIYWSLAAMVGGWALAYYGYQANVAQSPETIQGIWNMTAISPILSSAILLVIIGLFYHLKEKDVERMVEEIKEREEAQAAAA